MSVIKGGGREDKARDREIRSLKDAIHRKEDERKHEMRLKKVARRSLKDQRKLNKELRKMRLGGLESTESEIQEDEEKILSGDYSPADELALSHQIMQDLKKTEKDLDEELKDAFHRKDAKRVHELQIAIHLVREEEQLTTKEVSEEEHELDDDEKVVEDLHEEEQLENQEHKRRVA